MKTFQGLLHGKKGLIFGLANEKSIAWACAKIAKDQGAEVAITYLAPDKVFKQHIEPLCEMAGIKETFLCDATKKEDLDRLFQNLKERFGKLDFVVHSIAFAKKEELGELPFCKTSIEGFQLALNVSAFTFIDIANRASDLMPDGGSLTCMTYLGSTKIIDNYNVMGVAKAALESTTRYLAADLGKKNIRVNAISPGPIMTRAAGGIAHFDQIIDNAIKHSPLKRSIRLEEVAYTNAFLCSDWSSGITGQIIFVDGGENVAGV